MIKKISALILAAAMTFSSAAFTVSAHGGHGNGGAHHDETHLTGWQTIDGCTYYYKSSGEPVKKSCNINGVRYKFNSDGVCCGKYTGYVKSGENRYYYCDGIKQEGWCHLSDGWHCFDGEGCAQLTGEVTLYGKKYRFSDKGVWDGKSGADSAKIINKLSKKLSKDDCGGVCYEAGAIIVMSKNDEAVEKVVDEFRKEFAPIIVRHCKFSSNELEAVRNNIVKNMKKYGIHGVGTYVAENCVQAEMEKDTAAFNKYLDTLKDKSIVQIIYGKPEAVDD